MVRDLTDAVESDSALDGELVALDDEGHPNFNALQNATRETTFNFRSISTDRWPG